MNGQTQFKVGNRVHFCERDWNMYVEWASEIRSPSDTLQPVWKFIVNHENKSFTISSIINDEIRLKELDLAFPQDSQVYEGNRFRDSDLILETSLKQKRKPASNAAFRRIIPR